MISRWHNVRAVIQRARTTAEQQWRDSPVSGWFDAWVGELVALLPAALATRLGKREQPQQLTWPLPDEVSVERPAVLLLSADQVMAQRITLPVAATRSLNKVMQYELDKYTPYPAEQVHWVARVVRKRSPNAEVELVAVETTDLHDKLDACRARGIQLTALDALDRTGERRGVNLLPAGSGQRTARGVMLNRWLWGGCLILTVALAVLEVQQRQQQVDAMRQTVAIQREQVKHLQTLRQQLNDTAGASRYLAELKASRPTMSELLAELTECLGDDSWVEELTVEDGRDVTFAGHSQQASALITRVQECHTLEQVRFQGAIRADETTGDERFSIRARLKENTPHASVD